MSARHRGEPEYPPALAVPLLTCCTVSSFMTSFTKNRDSQASPIERTTPTSLQTKPEPFPSYDSRQDGRRTPMTPMTSSPLAYNVGNESPQPQVQRERASSRPMSMVQTFQPPLMDVSQDTLPELQPIFTFLNSHGNKLYQEGYFLKLDDQDTCTCLGVHVGSRIIF